MPSLLSAAEQAAFQGAMRDVFDTFARPFAIYLDAQVANISTSLTYSRFGDHSQNAAISADNPAVTPVVYTVTGCIMYGNKQPWLDIAPSPAQQLKLRESDGIVRIKVEATGHALLSQVKRVVLDGFTFQLNSTPRPHGIVGQPDRWTFTCEKVD
jgi:hypothetical protein